MSAAPLGEGPCCHHARQPAAAHRDYNAVRNRAGCGADGGGALAWARPAGRPRRRRGGAPPAAASSPPSPTP
jgi:hypothetical protein